MISPKTQNVYDGLLNLEHHFIELDTANKEFNENRMV
jgi:hypothetical protein